MAEEAKQSSASSRAPIRASADVYCKRNIIVVDGLPADQDTTKFDKIKTILKTKFRSALNAKPEDPEIKMEVELCSYELEAASGAAPEAAKRTTGVAIVTMATVEHTDQLLHLQRRIDSMSAAIERSGKPLPEDMNWQCPNCKEKVTCRTNPTCELVYNLKRLAFDRKNILSIYKYSDWERICGLTDRPPIRTIDPNASLAQLIGGETPRIPGEHMMDERFRDQIWLRDADAIFWFWNDPVRLQSKSGREFCFRTPAPRADFQGEPPPEAHWSPGGQYLIKFQSRGVTLITATSRYNIDMPYCDYATFSPNEKYLVLIHRFGEWEVVNTTNDVRNLASWYALVVEGATLKRNERFQATAVVGSFDKSDTVFIRHAKGYTPLQSQRDPGRRSIRRDEKKFSESAGGFRVVIFDVQRKARLFDSQPQCYHSCTLFEPAAFDRHVKSIKFTPNNMLFSPDDQFLSVIDTKSTTTNITFFRLPNLEPVSATNQIVKENVVAYSWSPSGNVFGYVTYDSATQISKMDLVEVPSMKPIRSITVNNVTEAPKMHWQDRGDYLALVVSKKNKGKSISDLHLFKMKVKDCPDSLLAGLEVVFDFSWDQGGSNKFVLHRVLPFAGPGSMAKPLVQFYGLPAPSKDSSARVKSDAESKWVRIGEVVDVPIYDDMNEMKWAPSGSYLALIHKTSGTVMFIDASQKRLDAGEMIDNENSLVKIAEHSQLTHGEWSPCGRFFLTSHCTAQRIATHASNYKIWDRNGVLVVPTVQVEDLHSMGWRPRSRQLVSGDRLEAAQARIVPPGQSSDKDSLWRKFNVEDSRDEQEQQTEQELVRKQRQKEWTERTMNHELHYKQEVQHRRDIRGGALSDDEKFVDEEREVEEEIQHFEEPTNDDDEYDERD